MAFALLNDSFDVQIIMQIGAQLTYTTLFYFDDSGDGIAVPNDIVDDWIASFETDILNRLIDNITWLETRFVKRNGGVDFTVIRSVNKPGNVVGDSLPAWDTYSFRKNPDNARRDPIGAAPFRPGRYAFSGVPEATQNSGTVTPAEIILLDVLAADIISFVHDLDTWVMYYVRRDPVTGSVTAGVPVLTSSFNRVGSQLTRKR